MADAGQWWGLKTSEDRGPGDLHHAAWDSGPAAPEVSDSVAVGVTLGQTPGLGDTRLKISPARTRQSPQELSPAKDPRALDPCSASRPQGRERGESAAQQWFSPWSWRKEGDKQQSQRFPREGA